MRPVNKPKPSPQLLLQKGREPGLVVATALLDTIGDFCSFCGLPVIDRPFIQDRVNGKPLKTPGMNNWSDYLLGCNYCASYRTASGIDINRYLWPDLDATFTLTSDSPFIYELTDVNVKREIKTVKEDPDKDVKVVLVRANPNAPADIQKKAQNTIDLYALNTASYNQETNTISFPADDPGRYLDMRLVYRTREWQRSLEAIKLLKSVKGLSDSSFVYDAALKNIVLMAQGAGSWSVWMTTFWNEFKDPALITSLFIETKTKRGYVISGYQGLDSRLPDDADKGPVKESKNSYMLFPGTAKDKIKFPG